MLSKTCRPRYSVAPLAVRKERTVIVVQCARTTRCIVGLYNNIYSNGQYRSCS